MFYCMLGANLGSFLYEDALVMQSFYLQEKCIKYREEADKAEGENKKICKVLDELRRGITILFKVRVISLLKF